MEIFKTTDTLGSLSKPNYDTFTYISDNHNTYYQRYFIGEEEPNFVEYEFQLAFKSTGIRYVHSP